MICYAIYAMLSYIYDPFIAVYEYDYTMFIYDQIESKFMHFSRSFIMSVLIYVIWYMFSWRCNIITDTVQTM